MEKTSVLSDLGKRCACYIFEMFKGLDRQKIEAKFGSEFYDYYEKYLKSNRIEKYEEMIYLYEQMISEINVDDKLLLDLGCGYGLSSIIFSFFGARITVGLDASVERFGVFKNLIKGRRMRVYPVLGNALGLPFKNNNFDVIYCNEFISHVSDLPRTIQECHRILKPGGVLFIGDTNKETVLTKIMMWKKYHRIESKLKPVIESIVKDTIQRHKLNLTKKDVERINPYLQGLLEEEIRDLVKKYAASREDLSKILGNYEVRFKFRDPYTGYCNERFFSPEEIMTILKNHGFINISFRAPIHYKTAPFKMFLTTPFLNKLFSKLFLFKFHAKGEKPK